MQPQTKAPTPTFSSDQLEAFADLIVDRVLARIGTNTSDELITPAELAKRVDRTRNWVYAHQADLGAVRLGEVGDNKRPRLYFLWPRVLERLDSSSTTTAGARSQCRRGARNRTTSTALLPIRGGDRD